MKKTFVFFISFKLVFAFCCCSPGVSCRIVNPSVQKSINKAKIDIRNNDKFFAKQIEKINNLMQEIDKLNQDILVLQDKIYATEKANSFILSNINKTQKKIKNLKILIIKTLEAVNNSISLHNKELLYRINLLLKKTNKEVK